MSTLFRNQSQGWWVLRDIIETNQEFHNTTNNFRGVHWNAEHAATPSRGQMPTAEYNRLAMHHALVGVDYVVYSYETVIAYRNRNGVWYVPSVKYSRTTTGHQLDIGVVADKLMVELENAK